MRYIQNFKRVNVLLKLFPFRLAPFLLAVALLGAFFFEGTGLDKTGYFTLHFVSIFVFISALVMLKNKKISIPKEISLVLLSLIIVFSVSTLLSLNKEVSFGQLLFFINAVISFFIAFNYKKIFTKTLPIIIFGTSFILFLPYAYSLFTRKYFITTNSFIIYPFNNNVIVSNHNHFGDLLAIALVLYFVKAKNRKNLLFWIINFFLILLIIFSSSLSALLMIVILLFIFLSKYLNAKIINKQRLFLIILGVVIFNLILLTFYIDKFDNSKINVILTEREIYYTNTMNALLDKPIFGYGPGNFVYSFYKFSSGYIKQTPTAKNIVLDMLVETGLVGTFIFLILIFTLLLRSKIDVNYYLIFAMIINFLTDYTYRYNSFLILFFILAGVIYSEKNRLTLKPIISTFILFFVCLILSLSLVQRFLWTNLTNSPTRSLTDKLVQQINMTSDLKSLAKEQNYINLLMWIAPNDPNINYSLAMHYQSIGKNDTSLYYLVKSYNSAPFKDVKLAEEIYTLTLKLHGVEKAKEFAQLYFYDYSHLQFNSSLPTTIKINAFCQKTYEFSCPFQFSTTEPH